MFILIRLDITFELACDIFEVLGEIPLLNCSIGFRYFSDPDFRRRTKRAVVDAVDEMFAEAGC